MSSDPPAAAAAGDDGSVCDYACYKCRRILFPSSTLLTHTPGQVTRSTFANKKASPLTSFSSSSSSPCSSVFVDPDALAVGAFTGNEGKLHCPRCRCKLGSFVWSGAQCSCGEWVVPAFMFSKSRVDEKRTSGEGGAEVRGRAEMAAPVIVFKPRLEQADRAGDREEKKDSAGDEQQQPSASPPSRLQSAAALSLSGSDLTPYR